MIKKLWIIPVLLCFIAAACKSKNGANVKPVKLDSLVISVSRDPKDIENIDQCLGMKSQILLNIPYISDKDDSITRKINRSLAESAFQSDWFKVKEEDLGNKEAMIKSLETAANTLLDSYSGKIVNYTYGAEKLLYNQKGILVLKMIVLSDICGSDFPLMRRRIVSIDMNTGNRMDFNEILADTPMEKITQAFSEKNYSIVSSTDHDKFARLLEELPMGDYAEAEKWMDDKGLHIYFNEFTADPLFTGEILFSKETVKDWFVNQPVNRLLE